MVRHVILWQFQDAMDKEERAAASERIRRELEALVGVVPGLISAFVGTTPMDTSNADLFLDSCLESREALAAYAVHPEHVRAATFVRSVVKSRTCMDFEV